jgi:hypothetical protein
MSPAQQLRQLRDVGRDPSRYLHPRLSAIEHTSSPDDVFAQMLKLIDGTSRGLPDPARVPTRDLDELDAIEMTKPTQEPAPKPKATAPSSAALPKSDAIPLRPAPEFAPRMKSLLPH